MKKKFIIATKAFVTTMFALASLLVVSPSVVSADPTSCYGAYGQATVCIDPTTGFGPLVYVYDANGYQIFATGVNYACTQGNWYITPKTYDSYGFVDYGAGSSYYAYFTSGGYNGCNATAIKGMAAVTQTQMNNIRWYSNSVNAQAVITVN